MHLRLPSVGGLDPSILRGAIRSGSPTKHRRTAVRLQVVQPSLLPITGAAIRSSLIVLRRSFCLLR
jgi:hypothetical protein